MKFNNEMHTEMIKFIDQYNLNTNEAEKAKSVPKMRAFVENNKRVIQLFKAFLAFLDSCPFALNEPVIGPDGKTYLVNSLFQKDIDNELVWSHANIIDTNGVITKVSLDQLKQYKAA